MLIWSHAAEAVLQLGGPLGNGWYTTDQGKLDYQWTDGVLHPVEIMDMLVDQQMPIDDSEPIIDDMTDVVFEDDDNDCV